MSNESGSPEAFAENPEIPRQASFAEFAESARGGNLLNVVFFGGSLTWGAQATDPQVTSYRALIARKLSEEYLLARFRFWDAAIGGTGSQLGAFRLERDVMARHPDLVFLDFTINDDPYPDPDSDRLASYESIVRRLVQRGIPVLQVILPAKKDVMSDAPPRPLDSKHKEIGSAYALPVADAVTLARTRVAEKQVAPDRLWDLPDDTTHPGDAGYALYADAVWNAYEQAVRENKTCRSPAEMLNPDTYMTVNRSRLSSFAPFPEGWKIGQPHRNAIAYDFVCSRWMDDILITEAGTPDWPRPLRFEVQGRNILLFGEGTMHSGSYDVRIDGGEASTYATGHPEGNWRHVQIIARGLDPSRKHTVEILPRLRPGEELRLESICVAGAPALVTVP